VPIDYFKAGQILADWTIWKTKANVNAVVIVSSEVYSTQSMVNGLEQQFKKECDHCKIRIVNVPIPEWSTQIQSTLQSVLLSDPTINYIIPIYDSMSQFVVPAITITGKRNSVKVATFNGTPFVLRMVQQGQVEMDLGENLDWVAHAVIDQEMRVLCNMEPLKDPKVPFYVFDASNAADAGNPPALSTGYGDAYKTGYAKLWGMEK
jgi:ribose transport system substrate-binding protein